MFLNNFIQSKLLLLFSAKIAANIVVIGTAKTSPMEPTKVLTISCEIASLLKMNWVGLSEININNNVGEDLLIAGSTVTISEKSKISDVLVFGKQ